MQMHIHMHADIEKWHRAKVWGQDEIVYHGGWSKRTVESLRPHRNE